jgi:hypothetical protein
MFAELVKAIEDVMQTLIDGLTCLAQTLTSLLAMESQITSAKPLQTYTFTVETPDSKSLSELSPND